MNRADLRAALEDPQVRAFLRVIRNGESSQDESAYRLENGGRVLPECPIDHPSKGLKSPPGKAFGAYQFLASTWAGLVKVYGFESMSPQCQDEAAVALIAERGALDEVLAGDLDGAFHLLERVWTSLPGGAEENRLTAAARETFVRWGGTLAGESGTKPAAGGTKGPGTETPQADRDPLATEHYGETVTESIVRPIPSADQQEARNMAFPIIPLITAFGPQLVQMIPQLASLFGSGSEVQVRNAKAATMAVDAIVQATGSPNLQAAVETMLASPEAAKAARAAVAEVMTLIEVGGGIAEARKAASSPEQIEWWRNPAVIVAILVLPLVYMVVSAVVFGVGGQSWSDDVKTLTVTAILSGALGSITGFFLGSSLGSQRKTNLLAKE